MEGSGSESVPLTNGSGSGEAHKNLRNTAYWYAYTVIDHYVEGSGSGAGSGSGSDAGSDSGVKWKVGSGSGISGSSMSVPGTLPVQHESFYVCFMGTARYRTGNKWASIQRHYRSIFGYRYGTVTILVSIPCRPFTFILPYYGQKEKSLII